MSSLDVLPTQQFPKAQLPFEDIPPSSSTSLDQDLKNLKLEVKTPFFEQPLSSLQKKKRISKNKRKSKRTACEEIEFDNTKTMATTTKKGGIKPAKYPINSIAAELTKIQQGKPATCSRCKKPILSGQLRIGLQLSHFNLIRWKHLDCFCIARKFFLFNPASIHNLSSLNKEDRQRVQDHFNIKSQCALNQLGQKKLRRLQRAQKQSKKTGNPIHTYAETESDIVETHLTKSIIDELPNAKHPSKNDKNMADFLSQSSVSMKKESLLNKQLQEQNIYQIQEQEEETLEQDFNINNEEYIFIDDESDLDTQLDWML